MTTRSISRAELNAQKPEGFTVLEVIPVGVDCDGVGCAIVMSTRDSHASRDFITHDVWMFFNEQCQCNNVEKVGQNIRIQFGNGHYMLETRTEARKDMCERAIRHMDGFYWTEELVYRD